MQILLETIIEWQLHIKTFRNQCYIPWCSLWSTKKTSWKTAVIFLRILQQSTVIRRNALAHRKTSKRKKPIADVGKTNYFHISPYFNFGFMARPSSFQCISRPSKSAFFKLNRWTNNMASIRFAPAVRAYRYVTIADYIIVKYRRYFVSGVFPCALFPDTDFTQL